MTSSAALAEKRFPIEGGCFIAVVGPSGAGKDSVMNAARRALGDAANVHFVRRCITRPVDGVHEDHEPFATGDFERAADTGAFALWWKAHGQAYGIPAAVDERIRDGDIVVANLSRTVLPELATRYARSRIVMITASPEAIAVRVAGRGREDGDAVRQRLARVVDVACSLDMDVIDNSGSLDAAAQAFVDVVRSEL